MKTSNHRRGCDFFIRLYKEDDRKANPNIVLTSDASSRCGCGAFWNTLWFQFEWSEALSTLHITNKELIPIVLQLDLHGGPNGKHVSPANNAAVIHIINSGTSSDCYAMALIRGLHFITARFNIALSAVHLPGSENALADALSHNNLSFFSP